MLAKTFRLTAYNGIGKTISASQDSGESPILEME